MRKNAMTPRFGRVALVSQRGNGKDWCVNIYTGAGKWLACGYSYYNNYKFMTKVEAQATARELRVWWEKRDADRKA